MADEPIEAHAHEVLRLARTMMQIISDDRTEPDRAAHQLMELLHTLTRSEALSLCVVQAATTVTVVEMAAKVIVDFTASLTHNNAPEWVKPRIEQDLRRFIDRSLDPERPEVRDMIHALFEQQQRENGP